ncbi:MAG: hypothetical protein AB7Q16_04460 [Vicinamibacterales bacterium]
MRSLAAVGSTALASLAPTTVLRKTTQPLPDDAAAAAEAASWRAGGGGSGSELPPGDDDGLELILAFWLGGAAFRSRSG